MGGLHETGATGPEQLYSKTMLEIMNILVRCGGALFLGVCVYLWIRSEDWDDGI